MRNTTGDNNTAIGFQALFSNIAGSNSLGGNTAIGFRALYHHVGVGNGSTAIGDSALFSNTTGGASTATGRLALYSNTTGFNNTANGVAALFHNTTGDFNTAIGVNALFSNTTASWNNAIGDSALISNTTGFQNTANGYEALFSNTTGSSNTADGFKALRHNTTGSFNIGLGYKAGDNLTIGSNNIDIGNVGVAGESATIRIGTPGTQTATFIAGISGATVVNGVQVMVNPNGKLGTLVSSARFKEAIKPMDKASEALFGLQPVTFRYKQEIDPDRIPQFGLVVEEVEKVSPDLVARDADGRVSTVRYEAVNAMLLNEFLKEHRTVQNQQKEIDALKAELKEQKALIQKVNARLEMNKAARQVAENN
jgi:Chaperone of endosialidase